MSVQDISISQIKPNPRNARTHSAKQIRQIANSIVAFGFTNPLLVSEDGELIAGHGRYVAAMQLGLDKVPASSSPDFRRRNGGPLRSPTTRSHKTRDGIASAWRSKYRSSQTC